MFYRFLATFLMGCFFAFSQLAIAQEKHHVTLRKIRREINKVEKKIAVSEKKETSILYTLTNLDLDIDLTQSIIQNLKKQEKQKSQEITRLGRNLKSTLQELKKLKEIFRKRLVYIYKYGRMKDVELLLNANSIHDGLLWLEYQKRLSEQDYRNYLKIKEKQAQIALSKDLLSVELEEKHVVLEEKTKEELNLKQKKQKRQKILKGVRRNTDLLRQQLTEKEKAAEQIRRLIVKLEATPRRKPFVKPNTPFSQMRGRMIWPTEGRIVSRFGKYKHPQLKTVTENIGIDIRADLGAPIFSVASGTVTAITWQRGRGNIIIISHYGGYYTVYTHLKELLVNLLEEVEMGQEIGNVGESGSLSGPILHFEVWKGTTKVNPEHWLANNS